MDGEEELLQKPLADSVTPLAQKLESSEEESPLQKNHKPYKPQKLKT